MRAIPRWFRRELKLLDPELKVKYNDTLNYFEVYKIVNHYISDKEGRRIQIKRESIRAVFDYLNDSALTSLRYRQYLARLHNAKGDPNAYTKLLRRENKEARKKEHLRGQEMINAGYRKMYMVGRQKYYA